MDESDSQSEQSENFGYSQEQLSPCHMWPCDSPKNATYVNLLPPVAWWHDADNTLGAPKSSPSLSHHLWTSSSVGRATEVSVWRTLFEIGFHYLVGPAKPLHAG